MYSLFVSTSVSLVLSRIFLLCTFLHLVSHLLPLDSHSVSYIQVLGDAEGAIVEYHNALDLHDGHATAEAHHHLALALLQTGGDAHAVTNHLEQSLNLGHPPTAEAIRFLGEDSLAVRRAINRQQWAEYERAQALQYQQRGGIMSGGGSSLDSGSGGSVFASSQNGGGGADDEGGAGPSQLDILAVGAAAYDGTVPTGEESETGGGDGGGGLSPGLSGQGAASSRARA